MIKFFLISPVLALSFAAIPTGVKAAPQNSAPLPLSNSQVVEIRRRIALLQPGTKDPIGKLKIEKYLNGTEWGNGPMASYWLTQDLGSNCSFTLTMDYSHKPGRFLKAKLDVKRARKLEN